MNLSEIETVAVLQQPDIKEKQKIFNLCNKHYRDNVYYHDNGQMLTIACKDNNLLGYIVGIRYHNPNFKDIPYFIVPQNIYSWAFDHGITALTLIKALIDISKIPVLGDISMTIQAKKFMKKAIDSGNIKAKIFDLNTGDISQYDDTVLNVDDNHRVLFLENKFGGYNNSKIKNEIPIYEGIYNWLKISFI